ncbi:FecR family protein [Pedobacter africanus]|uniref:FecR family protein n=1 Tax=Pedobacter africanus TaxID=151894 RepID=A0A1W1ZIW0_9SPHI|nr:FecR family protein [Pedobacter africanus]SMC48465.1 FecR family protein [Pedobacter africanus]
MDKKRILYLLQQYYNNTLSVAETTELSQLIDQIGHEDAIAVLTETINTFSEPENGAVNIDETEIKAKVNQILSVDRRYPVKTIKHPKTRLLKYSIAAAAAIIALVGSYLVFQNFSNLIRDNPIAEANQKDVQPGQAGAILVLSDGREVLLDSAGSSQVIIDHNGSKIKVSNGRVVYLDGKKTTDPEHNLNSIRTPAGRQYHLTLSDGTEVWLNAASSMEYPVAFSEKTRKVSISGEAYFEVAKNAKQPFIVSIKNSKTNIEVLGTHFNINSYADHGSYKTTLLEGSIKLSTGKRQLLLKPNQQAVSQPDSEQIELISNVNAEDILAWKNDLFHFNQASIEDVMRELARWYNIEVVYEGSRPTGTFTGKIQKGLTLRQALKILGATRVQYELTTDNKLLIQ